MLISELIDALLKTKEDHGDVRVMIYDSREDFYTVAENIHVDEADKMVVAMSMQVLSLGEKFIVLK